MRFSRFSSAVLSVVLLVTPLVCKAWNAEGHMVVAKIAYDRLQPNVRAKVDAMVTVFSKEYPDLTDFVQIASWPDAIRSQKIESFTHWHYVDLPITADNLPTKNITDTDNAVWALNTLEPVVHNEHANPYERARFLAFLVHIVGDLHQPMHAVSRISLSHPDGDAGGNLFSVQWNQNGVHKTNLHHIWDEGLGVFTTKETLSNVDELAKAITALYPESSFQNVTDLKPSDWAEESNSDAKIAYETPENELPSSRYIIDGKNISGQRVALAGYRLAALLNQLLK